MRIACDVDGVVCNILTPLAKRINREFGKDIQPDHLEKFDLSDTLKQFDIKSTWLYKCYKDDWFWAEGEPIEESIDTLKRWISDHEIFLITARHNDSAIPTRAWLKKHDVPFTELKFTPAMKKYEVMLQYKCDFLIEDRFFEADKAASYGFPAFVVRRSYNVAYESRIHNPLVQYVDGLADIDSFMEKYEEFQL